MHGGSLTLSLVPIRVHPHLTPQTTGPSVEPVSANDHTAHTAHAALDITASSPGRPSHQARVLPHTSPPRLQAHLPSLRDPLEGPAEADWPGVPVEPEPPDMA